MKISPTPFKTLFCAAVVCGVSVPTLNAQAAPATTSTSTLTPAAARPSARTSPVLPTLEGEELANLLKKGATMEEVAKLRDPIAKTPAEAIRALKAGNARFYGNVAQRPELSANERRAQVLSQSPFAIVLGCSDSRVPTEIVYDQGLGSLFITRVAGNVVDPVTVGSVEYAVKHLDSHLVVVMGHEGCGAVAAAMLPKSARDGEPSNVRFLLDKIAPVVAGIPPIRDNKAKMREAVISNVRAQVAVMKANPTIASAIKSGQIAVIGAFYEIGSGAVDFLETPEDLRLSPLEATAIANQVRVSAASDAGTGLKN